jgi:ketosteroid isomerase-like protein
MLDKQKITETLIVLESAALERWGNGDPSGFLEISASDVVYFDPYLDKQIDGIEALTQYYKTIWGQVRFDRFELLNPCVQVGGELAILTFNYISYTGNEKSRWNCTEVYRQNDSSWKIIQTHWSYTRHPSIVGN